MTCLITARTNYEAFVPSLLVVKMLFLLMCQGQQTPPTHDVIVVGAGAAGLSAAAALRSAGVDVVVLEGRNRIGGRIQSVELNDTGGVVDVGAAWIHGVTGNPLTELTQQYGIITQPTNPDQMQMYSPKGHPLPPAAENAIYAQMDAYLQAVAEFQLTSRQDTSLQELLDVFLSENGLNSTLWLDWALAVGIVYGQATELPQLSALWWDIDTTFPGGQAMFPGGYSQVVDALAEGVAVRLGEAVQGVRYGPGQGVVVTTAGGGEYRASAAIVTVPLGVLKEGGVTFEPPLPPQVQSAIGRLGMGLLDKTILSFPEVFWEEEAQRIGYISSTPKAWAGWTTPSPVTGQPVLIGFNAADYARRLEGLSDEAVVAEALGVLRTIYGPSVPAPSASLVTRWGSDPWSRGSYSYNAVGSSPADRRVLGGALGGGSLFLAGEHVSVDSFATVHGALLSGRAQAQAVLRQLRR